MLPIPTCRRCLHYSWDVEEGCCADAAPSTSTIIAFYLELLLSLAGQVNPSGSKIANVFFMVWVMQTPLPSALKAFVVLSLRVVVSFLLTDAEEVLYLSFCLTLLSYLSFFWTSNTGYVCLWTDIGQVFTLGYLVEGKCPQGPFVHTRARSSGRPFRALE